MPRSIVYGRRASRVWLIASAALAVLVLVLAAWIMLPNSPTNPTNSAIISQRPDRPYRLIWNGPITPAAAGAIVAQSSGIFAREGLQLTLQASKDDASVVLAVADDDRAIGHITATDFLRARSAGTPIVAFASGYMTSSVELYALPITTLNSPTDLGGKALGYIPESDVGVSIEALIRKQQVPRSQIKVVSTQTSVTDLLHGRIDVLAGRSELEGEELRSLNMPYRVLSPAAFGVQSVGTVYIVSEQALARWPQLAERFLAALIQGWDIAYADYEKVAILIEQAISHDTAPAGVTGFMNRQRAAIRPYGARIGELDLARWRELQDRLLAQQVIFERVDLRPAIMFSVVPELYRTRFKALATN